MIRKGLRQMERELIAGGLFDKRRLTSPKPRANSSQIEQPAPVAPV